MQKTKKIFKLAAIYIGNLILFVSIAVGLAVGFSLLPIKNNYKIYNVMSGSMSPTIETGSVVVSKPQSNYVVGDIITFKSFVSNQEKTTTHRIKSIEEIGEVKIYTTTGDANNIEDPDKVTPELIIGKVRLVVPYMGYVFGYVKTPIGLIFIIVIPATIIIYEELRKIRHETKQIIKRRKEKKTVQKAQAEEGVEQKQSSNQNNKKGGKK